MKVTLLEMRNMVAVAVRQALSEAKRKPKEIPAITPEAEAEQREKKIRATGYSFSNQNDYSKPLGKANRLKKQGAANFGNWTSESIVRKIREMQLRKLVRMIVQEEVRAARGR